MNLLTIAVGLTFAITALGAGFGIIAGHIAVAVYLILIALAGATSVWVADGGRTAGGRRRA